MCKRTMYKRARIPMFLWERRACANSGAQAVFPRPRKNGLGTRQSTFRENAIFKMFPRLRRSRSNLRFDAPLRVVAGLVVPDRQTDTQTDTHTNQVP